ncbi:hypothetical protein BDV93DRAFT_510197 [Ceratobasidium sp. AG-I]|nr:hypothetical protein BDV93DRAFT_510197 [Ceratobasidium sp. AG-I]
MISKIKQKAKEKGQRYANKLFVPSSEHSVRQLSSVLVNDARAINTPVPSVALQEPGLNLNALEPLGSPPQITPISSPQPAVASIALPAPDASPPLTQANVSHLPVVQDTVPIQGSSSVSTAPSVAERSGTNTAWSGLKTLIELLNASADAFGPLKSAVGGISKFIEINDARVAAGKEYKELHRELDELFRNLSGYLGDSMPLAMKSSLDSLANGIKREVKFVQGKEQRNQGERFAEAIEDADKILECYRRIQRLLERFSLNVNVSTWKTVDEQATVCARDSEE